MLKMCVVVVLANSALVLFATCATADDAATQSPDSDRSIKIESAILKAIDSTAISAQSSGVLCELNVKEGSKISLDELMAKIRDDAIRLKLGQQNTQMLIAKKKHENTIDREVAQKSREVAETEYSRALAANKRVANTYPLNEIDRLRLVAERGRLEVNRAEYEIEKAGLDYAIAKSEYEQTAELLDRHLVKSPVTGVVVNVEKHLGEWVEPGTEILRIVRTDTLRIEGFIPASQDDGRLIGSKVMFRLANQKSNREYSGTVVFVSPEVNPVNSMVRVFAEVTNSDGSLRPGPAVQAAIVLTAENTQVQNNE